MEKIGVTRKEIEEKISNAGDYVKMDYLSACLKKNIDFDTKKFVISKLYVIYEARGMYGEAARLVRAMADISTTFDGKIKDFLKAGELFIKAGSFDEADIVFNKAIAIGNNSQKQSIKVTRKNMYKVQAQDYIKKDKRTNALKAYEKLLTLDLDGSERKETQDIVMGLYEKLGKVREFYNMKKVGSQPKADEVKKFVPEPTEQDLNDLLGL